MELQQTQQQEEPRRQPKTIYPSTVRFLYLRDNDNSNRVLTIARQLTEDKKTVQFSFAMNKPASKNRKELEPNILNTLRQSLKEVLLVKEDAIEKVLERFKKMNEVFVGDKFTRAEGRRVSFERLQNKAESFSVELTDKRPIETILHFLTKEQNIPALVKKLAYQGLISCTYDELDKVSETLYENINTLHDELNKL